MVVELQWLAWSVVVGLAYLVVAASLGTMQRGLKWNVGNRDGQCPPFTGMAARAQRASANFLETFVFFAAAVLAVVLAHKTTPGTALGAQLYFWSRLAYLPIYLIGVPYLRTLVWAVSIWGLIEILAALF